MTTHTDNPARTISQWLLLAIVFLLPLQTRWIVAPGILNGSPWEYGTLSLYAIDLLIGAFLFFGWVAIANEKKKPSISTTELLALLLLAISFCSLLWATNENLLLFWWVKLAEAVTMFFVIRRIQFQHAHVALVLVASGTVQAVLAISQFLTQMVFRSTLLGMAQQFPGTLGVQVVEGGFGRVLRAYGSLPHPNILGGFLVVSIIATAMLYLQHRTYPGRAFIALSLALQSVGLWASFSRQAWLALGIVLCVLTVYTFLTTKSFPRAFLMAMLYIAIPFVLFTAAFPQLVGTRVQATERLEARSLTEREQYTQDAASIIRDNWIYGVGLHNYTATLYGQDDAREGYEYQPVHNIFLLVLSELGIFGLLAFTGLIISTFYSTNPHNPWQLGWRLSLLALIVVGCFDHYLWTLSVGMLLFWCILALSEHTKEQ